MHHIHRIISYDVIFMIIYMKHVSYDFKYTNEKVVDV